MLCKSETCLEYIQPITQLVSGSEEGSEEGREEGEMGEREEEGGGGKMLT